MPRDRRRPEGRGRDGEAAPITSIILIIINNNNVIIIIIMIIIIIIIIIVVVVGITACSNLCVFDVFPPMCSKTKHEPRLHEVLVY